MLKKIVAIVILSMMVLGILAGCFQNGRVKDSTVILVIDGEELTHGEFKKYLYANESLYTNNQNFTESEKDQRLEYYINEHLFYEEAKKQGIEINDDQLDEQYRLYKQSVIEEVFNNNENSYNNRVKNLELDEDYLKDNFEKKVVINMYVEQLKNSVEAVTVEDVEEFYDENLEELFTHKEERRAIRHILVDSEDVAQAMLIRIDQGEDFGDLAFQYSNCPSKENGGILTPATKNSFVEPFSKAAFKLEEGQISEVVKTEFGYHILEVLEIIPPGVTPLDGMLAEGIFIELTKERERNIIPNKIQELRENAEIVKK